MKKQRHIAENLPAESRVRIATEVIEKQMEEEVEEKTIMTALGDRDRIMHEANRKTGNPLGCCCVRCEESTKPLNNEVGKEAALGKIREILRKAS